MARKTKKKTQASKQLKQSHSFILNPGRIACPTCAVVQYISPNVRKIRCKGCQEGLRLSFQRGQVVSVIQEWV